MGGLCRDVWKRCWPRKDLHICVQVLLHYADSFLLLLLMMMMLILMLLTCSCPCCCCLCSRQLAVRPRHPLHYAGLPPNACGHWVRLQHQHVSAILDSQLQAAFGAVLVLCQAALC